MSWLSYSDDEVTVFHPEFESVAREALNQLGLTATHEWLHHPVSTGVGVVPDFVLVEKASGRWVLVFEIKRRPDTVNSERNQIQAKGYAEANDSLYSIGRPRFFVISNMEITLGFALRGSSPPKDCRLNGMSYDSGRFVSTPRSEHRLQFCQHLKDLVSLALSTTTPEFTSIWPRIAQNVYHHSEGLPYDAAMDTSVGMLPEVVRDYFSIDYRLNAQREMMVRCLLAEYLRGLLRRHDHPRKNSVGAVGNTLSGVANALVLLRSIDFAGVFEDNCGPLYLGFESNPAVRSRMENYLASLASSDVSTMAANRADSYAFPETLVQETAAPSVRDAHGKAATDAELAGLLAALTITDPRDCVLDPGCGEGNLISAAYDRLRSLGVPHEQVLSQVVGVEADSLTAKIAALRLAIKEPRLANTAARCRISVADMFSSPDRVAEADIVLMNPPFKRYESQDVAPIPIELRAHFRDAIARVGGSVEADRGQANIFSLYVEFVIKSARPGATIGIILDNKWFDNETARALRQLVLRHCEVLAVVTYPHSQFFEQLMIATSMLIIRKSVPSDTHEVSFVRVEEPGRTGAQEAAAAIRGGLIPDRWSVRKVRQTELNPDTWKPYLSEQLVSDFRKPPLKLLPELFSWGRRGSLAKEGGGIAVYEFPERTQYGPKRSRKAGGRPFQTNSNGSLTRAENSDLRTLAQQIPNNLRGYAINKADRIAGYEISSADVTRDWTLETPLQRSSAIASSYFGDRRKRWDRSLDQVVIALRSQPETQAYIDRIEQVVGLDEGVLPKLQLWNVLREPYAGELIIPRKQRVGHRVHINSYAFNRNGRQVRLSSNFLSYGECIATDPSSGPSQQDATRIIAAWLISSFGNLQFELESNNREGARSVEQRHTDKIWVIDPRSIQARQRSEILSSLTRLPFPVRTDVRVELQPELMQLDQLFAAELARLIPGLSASGLLTEVWDRLHELQEARNH